MALTPVLGRVYIDVPPFTPNPDGILAVTADADTLITVADGTPSLRGFQFETDGVKQIATLSVTDCMSTAAENAFDGFDVVQSGNPFTVYAGYECSLATFNQSDWKTRSERRLANGESVGVERALWANVFPAATDITPTPGTAVKPLAALGIAAEWAGSHYAGTPWFHMGRRLTTVYASLNIVDDENPHILVGTGGLVSGGGYTGTGHPTSGSAPTANQAWLYITGRVILVRGSIDTYQGVGLPTNDAVAVSERTYVPAVESILAAILVDLT